MLKLIVMKKLAVVVSIFTFFSLSGIVKAQDLSFLSATPSGLLITLKAGDIHQGDYFATGENVLISGTVNGDVYAAGGQVVIDGNVTGDVLAAGGTVTVKGQVAQDVRVAGGQVLVGGEIGKNLTILGGNLVIASDAQLGGNVVAAGGNLAINSPIPGDLKAGVGNLLITSNVEGNVDAAVSQLTLTPKVVIKGDLTYKSDQVALIAGEATVSGRIKQISLTPADLNRPASDPLAWSVLKQKITESLQRIFTVFFWTSLLGSLVTGYLLVHFFPNFTYNAITSIENHPWKTLGIGFLVMLLAGPVIILALVTVIGIPVGLILTAVYLIALYLSRILFSYWLGARFIHRLARTAGRGVTLTVGLLLFYLLSAITYFGPILTLCALLWGLGALFLTEKKTYLAARKSRLI